MRTKIIKKSSEEGINYLKQKNAGLNLIDKIYYINLDHRTDRLESIRKEIKMIDPGLEKSERISAIRRKIGIIGCGESHVKTLKKAYDEGHETVLIFEDDFKFKMEINKIKEVLTNFVKSHPDYNIFCLGRNLMKGLKLPSGFIEILECQTTSCYMVKRKFIPELIKVFQESVDELNSGSTTKKSALDIKWKILQKPGGKFYTSIEPLGIQMKSYSDIENKIVFYNC